jgi:hypothetical protein
MPALLGERSASEWPESPESPAGPPVGPEQGVIEEARRRQRRRRVRLLFAGVLATGLAGLLAWAVSGGGSNAARANAHAAGDGALAIEVSDDSPPGFNVRLVPTLTVGEAGWCEVPEEHGVSHGSSCGGVATLSSPFQAIFGWGEAHARYGTELAITDPQVVAVLVDGRRRVATVALPGLPYGMRAARLLVPTYSSSRVVAVQHNGRRLAEHWTNTPRQATVRSWRYPQRSPRGVCELRARGPAGLSARGGAVATSIRPFPGALVGHAFLPCAMSEYSLKHIPIKAVVLLDAANPRGPVAALPDFHAVHRAPGVYANGGLVARRSGNAWLVVGQGASPAQQISLLSSAPLG